MSDQTQHPDVTAIIGQLDRCLRAMLVPSFGYAVESHTVPGQTLFTSRTPDRHGVRITIDLFPDAEGCYISEAMLARKQKETTPPGAAAKMRAGEICFKFEDTKGGAPVREDKL